MSAARLKLLHLSPQVRGAGGVEGLLARHGRSDPAQGFEAFQLALFDRGAASAGETYTNLGFSWRDTPRAMCDRVKRAFAAHGGSVVVWHNAWGMPWFAQVDGSSRRIAYLHASEKFFHDWLPRIREWVDAIICDNPAAARACVRLLPGFPSERILALTQPIDPPFSVVASRPAHPTWIIGCAGRLVHRQKRWERLVPFVSELRRLGVPFRLEVVGDGPLRGWLEQRLAGSPGVEFFGWLKGDDYWRRLQAWDAAVFFSDEEGLPFVMIEVLAAGVIPVYPAIGGSLGDEYAPRVDPRCLYKAGDPVAAARALRELLASPSGEMEELRRRAQALGKAHETTAYEATFASFVREVATLPRLSREPRGQRRPRWVDWLPLGLVTRLWPTGPWR